MSQVTRMENPFGNNNQVVNRPSTALVDTESQRAIAEVQASLAIAKRFPRDQIAATDRILNACQRPRMAETAVYQYSRGGTSINGPSIRLAEMLAQNWGNIQYGIRELSQANGESTVEAFAWDLETNTRQTKIFQVPHVRYAGGTTKPLKDPRDIYEVIANNGARRLRACILGVIPGDVVDVAVTQCDETLRANADTSPAAVQKLVSRFENYGVTKEMIEKRIQCRIDAIKPAQVMSLIKIGTSLKEGMSAADDWFDMKTVQAEPEGAANDINSKINAGQVTTTDTEKRGRGSRKASEPAPQAAPTTTPDSFEEDTAQPEQVASQPERVEKLLVDINQAKSAAELTTLSSRYMNGLNNADVNTLKNAMGKRSRELMNPAPQAELEKPSLAARMQACTDSNDLSILSTEIEFLDPAIRDAMWQVYEKRLNELNA